VNVSPFLLLKRSTADLLASRARTALNRWAAAWTTLSDLTATCTPPGDGADLVAANYKWIPYALANGASVWIHVQTGLVHTVEQALFDLPELDGTSEKHLSSSLAMSVAEEALADLSENLIKELTGQASQPAQQPAMPDRLFRPGSGAVLCSVNFAGKSLKLMLPPESMPLTAPPILHANLPPIASLQHALETTLVTLSVEISRTELTLGYLKTLAVGDVLALPTSVDHPLRVTSADDITVCHAHLGSLTGFHAIELIKSTD
jgi:flagellar motor switch/type III secretory pathway protein FliN